MTELRHFDLNLLSAFDLLMQEQNVSRAAERMFVSQSAMSHILQRLRQQLEDPLLVKTPAGMKPTERANAPIDPVRVILRDLERLIRAPEQFDPSTSRRRFVIAATDYMDYLVVPPLIVRVARQVPISTCRSNGPKSRFLSVNWRAETSISCSDSKQS
ncbi:MAG: LysR family transcriptional regulator [Methylococcales bacterium]